MQSSEGKKRSILNSLRSSRRQLNQTAAHFLFANTGLSKIVMPRELSYLSCSPELLWLDPMLLSSLLMFVDSTFPRILMRNLEEPKTLIIPRVTK